MVNPNSIAARIMSDPCASYPLKEALARFLDRDPVDALNDAEALALVKLIRQYNPNEIPNALVLSYAKDCNQWGGADPEVAPATSDPAQPAPRKTFHMPSVRRRDDMGGLLGSD